MAITIISFVLFQKDLVSSILRSDFENFDINKKTQDDTCNGLRCGGRSFLVDTVGSGRTSGKTVQEVIQYPGYY